MQPVSATSLTKYLGELYTHTREKVVATVPDRFGLVIDGWTSGSRHFIAIFAVYDDPTVDVVPAAAQRRRESGHEFDPDIECLTRKHVLLSFCPVEEEDDLRAQSVFVELEPAIGSLDHDSFVKLQLTSVMLDPAEVAQVRLLSEQLAQLDEVTHALQDSTLTLVGVRAASDAVVAEHPQLRARLDERAAIVNNPVLESGIVKIIRGQRLAAAEEVECARFRLASAAETVQSLGKQTSLLASAFKKRKTAHRPRFMALKWVPPPSNACERLFSATKFIYSDLRKRLDSYTLEFLVFNNMANKDFWGVRDVDDVLR
ncbi:hypothetical protein P43SY_009915 [Pythium insidiosum]|uniref:HAT C-terminal dimerisation domain-containing protein n=1 Tax=Pythium insidiosum TaxID=114742 RepID=A0AAD5Q3R3_PYTIN|nr:hypothetical protein P43SY_009915 [Pythium insidiosum]